LEPITDQSKPKNAGPCYFNCTVNSKKCKAEGHTCKHCIAKTAEISLISDNKPGKFVCLPHVCLSELQSRTNELVLLILEVLIVY